jgi:hypothetical protein
MQRDSQEVSEETNFECELFDYVHCIIINNSL